MCEQDVKDIRCRGYIAIGQGVIGVVIGQGGESS